MVLKILLNSSLKVNELRNLSSISAFYPWKFHQSRFKGNRSSHSHDYFGNHQKFIGHAVNFMLPSFLIGAICGYGIQQHFGDGSWRDSFGIPKLRAKKKNLEENRIQHNFVADVVEVSASSVVSIEIKERFEDDLDGEILSNGSGFVVQSNGLILTSAHVIIKKPETFIQVTLVDGRQYTGEVEDIDLDFDLALLRIKCNNLPVMKLGESASLKAGEWVAALGSPLALSNTVTAGIVSSIQRQPRELKIQGKNISYIQTDAAITFGNSGGPLVNLGGEAIGINCMKVTSGISFAIPIDYAKEFLAKWRERQIKGKMKEGKPSIKQYVGFTLLNLTPDILYELRQNGQDISDKVTHGILLWRVLPGSPAHK